VAPVLAALTRRPRPRLRVDRSRCGIWPISMRSTTDLDAEVDRSRWWDGV